MYSQGPKEPSFVVGFIIAGGHFKPNQRKIKTQKKRGGSNGGLNSHYRFDFMTFADFSILQTNENCFQWALIVKYNTNGVQIFSFFAVF